MRCVVIHQVIPSMCGDPSFHFSFNADRLLESGHRRGLAIISTFGAAGSLAVIMLWVYYVSLIMLYRAEITPQPYRL